MQVNTPTDGLISITDDKPFVQSDDVDAGQTQVEAYTIEGPEGYVVGIDEGTPIACEFRAADGSKLPGSTRVVMQKCDRQGNALGSGIVFNELLDRFNYTKMRNDPDFLRRTQRGLMVDEYEIVKIFVEIPEGGPAFSAAESTLTIGDETSDFGKAVEVVDHNNLSEEESQAVKQASQANGGS